MPCGTPRGWSAQNCAREQPSASTATPAAATYAVTSGELQSDAHGLAAPVLGVDGLRASVGIVTLGAKIDEQVVAPRVIAAATAVADRLR